MTGTEMEDVPGRSLEAWDHLAWHHWGACCPSPGWALLLRSEKHTKRLIECDVVCTVRVCVCLSLVYRGKYVHDATKVLEVSAPAIRATFRQYVFLLTSILLRGRVQREIPAKSLFPWLGFKKTSCCSSALTD